MVVMGSHDVMGAANDAVLTTDALGAITFANDRAADLFDLEPAQLRGKPLAQFIPGADHLISGHHSGAELLDLFAMRGERELPVEVSLAAFRDGEPGFVVIVRDASARAMLVNALAEREAQIAELEALANAGSYELDLETGSIVWSAQLCQICGIQPDVTPSVGMLVQRAHPEDRTRVSRFISPTRTSREPTLLDFRIVRPDGQVRAVTAQLQVRVDRRGHAVRHSCTIRDVTAKARARPRRARSTTSRSRT
jgi:PAS domain S-box-containing protein